MTKGCTESSLWNIRLSNADLIVPLLQVNRAEVRSTTQFVQQVVNMRQWIAVSHTVTAFRPLQSMRRPPSFLPSLRVIITFHFRAHVGELLSSFTQICN